MTGPSEHHPLENVLWPDATLESITIDYEGSAYLCGGVHRPKDDRELSRLYRVLDGGLLGRDDRRACQL